MTAFTLICWFNLLKLFQSRIFFITHLWKTNVYPIRSVHLHTEFPSEPQPNIWALYSSPVVLLHTFVLWGWRTHHLSCLLNSLKYKTLQRVQSCCFSLRLRIVFIQFQQAGRPVWVLSSVGINVSPSSTSCYFLLIRCQSAQKQSIVRINHDNSFNAPIHVSVSHLQQFALEQNLVHFTRLVSVLRL